MRVPRDASALRDLSARQRLLTAEDIRGASIGRGALRAARREGALVHLWRGTDLTTETPPARWAAALALHSDAVLSSASGVRLRGFAVPREWPEEITVPRTSSRLRSRDGLVVRSRLVPAEQRETFRGLATTTLVRTLADLALAQPRYDVQWIVDQALARGLPRDAVDSLPPLQGGRRALRRLLADGCAESESPLETALRLVLADGGIPAPVLQHRVPGARLDFAWPEQRVAVEADGLLWHSAPEPLLRDRSRQNALMASGWSTLRATWGDVRAPSALLSVLESLLLR